MSKKIKMDTGFSLTERNPVGKLISNIVLGLAVIAVGVGYLGNELSFCPWSNFTLFFPGWGALFLIVPGVYGLIRKPLSWFWPICILAGVLIILAKQEGYGFATAAAIVLAVAVILVGLRIALSPLFKKARRARMKKRWRKMAGGTDHVIFTDAEGGETIDGVYSVRLGDRTVNIDREFTSATVICTLGNMIFNIRNALIPGCAVIDVTCHCGNIEIHLPADARAEVISTFRAGNFQNLHTAPLPPDAPIVYVNLDGSNGNVIIY